MAYIEDLYDWVCEARKQIEQRFSTSCLRVRNLDISYNDFYVLSFVDSSYIYKVEILAQPFVPSLGDPIDEIRSIYITRIDMDNETFDKVVFDNWETSIEDALNYLAS